MIHNDSSKNQYNPIQLKFITLFQCFEKHLFCKMDKSGHATILWHRFCKRYATRPKQVKLHLSLQNNQNKNPRLKIIPPEMWCYRQFEVTGDLLPMLTINLKSIIIIGKETKRSSLSFDKHTTTNYTYRKALQIIQARLKWPLQTKTQHTTAARTSFMLMKPPVCIKSANTTLYHTISQNVMAIRFDATFCVQDLRNAWTLSRVLGRKYFTGRSPEHTTLKLQVLKS